MKKAEPVKTTIMLDPQVWRAATIVASLKGISRQELITLALVKYFQTKIPKKERAIIYYSGDKSKQVNAS